MNVIQLRLIVPAPARRELLRRAFGADPELAVVSHETDIEHGAAPDVFVVDLATPEATLPWFWMMLHIRYPMARFMAVTNLPVDEAVLQAALHAGAHTILTWADPAARMCAAARAANKGQGYIPLAEVLHAISTVLTRSSLSTHSFRVGDLSLNLLRGQVTLGPHRLHLSRLEFYVLTYLTQNPGRLVSYAELLREIWQDTGRVTGTGRVRSCLKSLQRKLRKNQTDARYIVTVRGLGYRMLTDREWQAQTAPNTMSWNRVKTDPIL